MTRDHQYCLIGLSLSTCDCYCNGRIVENGTNRRRRLLFLVSDFQRPLLSRSRSCCLELSSIDPTSDPWTQSWSATKTLAPNLARLQHDNAVEVGNADHNEGSACCHHLNSGPDKSFSHLRSRRLGSLHGPLGQAVVEIFCRRVELYL